MKYSIKRQMMTVFVGLILFMIVVFMIVNGSFLEKYYISNKKSEFIKAYTMVQEGVENGTIDSETPEKDLGRFTEKNNISIAVIDSEYNVVYTNVREKQMMVVQLFGYLYDKNHQEVLEKTDSYDICKSVDPQNNTEYLTMWGSFDNGDIFIMRSPLESIRSAVMIFNRFIGVVGGCVILVSVLLAWYFSKRITEPIMELATLSQKMADLDFDAKYTSGGSNEIGVLGENFNRMSERLEQTISNLKEANYKLQKDIEQKEAQVIFRHKNPVYVWADEFKVEQVVRNYVNNALNHIDGEKVIEIKITQENDMAKITVFNTGTPIPEEDLPHIWEKFYKVDKARTREYGGNGIGLSIVKAIMDSFGKGYGAINHTNGVEFWFELDMK